MFKSCQFASGLEKEVWLAVISVYGESIQFSVTLNDKMWQSLQ